MYADLDTPLYRAFLAKSYQSLLQQLFATVLDSMFESKFAPL